MRALFDHPLSRARALILLILLLPFTSPITSVMGDRVFADGMAHVVITMVLTGVSLFAAVATSRAAWRRYDLRSALVASGFTAMLGLLAIHGLATPGGPIFSGMGPTVEYASVLALPVGGMFIVAAMVLSPRSASSRPMIVAIQLGTLAACVAAGVVGLAYPELLPTRSLIVAPMSYVVLTTGALLFGLAGLRAHRIAELTRRGGDAAIFAGIMMLAVALAVYTTATSFSQQFWFGHFLEGLGIACISAGVVADLRRPVSAWRLTQSRDGEDVATSSEELLGGYVHALTVTLSQVDPSTWEHSRRVAELAVAVGEELDLDAVTVRRLAVAGLVHDIGKLRIPHSVLHKAGKLSPEEFEFIKAHPDFGVELLSHLRGFDAELSIVLGHHEKLSGRGYPQGLSGDEIDLETRIMTACDVYDALTDARSYKEPWPVERAIALLHEEAGESFDPLVVAALERVVTRRGTLAPAADDRLLRIMPSVPAIQPIDTPAGLIDDDADLQFPRAA